MGGSAASSFSAPAALAQPPMGTSLPEPLPERGIMRIPSRPPLAAGAPSPLSLSPDGTMAAFQDGHDSLQVVDIASGKVRWRCQMLCRSIAFSPDCKYLAVAPGGPTIKLWDAAKLATSDKAPGAPVAVLDCEGNVNAFVFAPDGKRLATAEEGGVARIYDVASKRLLAMLKPPDRVVFNVVFSPDGKLVATLGRRDPRQAPTAPRLWDSRVSQDVRLWDSFTGEPRPVGADLEQSAHTVVFHPNGKTLAAIHLPEAVKSLSADRAASQPEDRFETIRIWDPASVHEIFRFRDPILQKDPALVKAVTIGRTSSVPAVFAPDGRALAAPGAGGVVVYETASGKPRLRLRGHGADITALALTPDGKTLVSASWDSTIMIWDVTGLRTRGKLTGSALDHWAALGDPSAELAGRAIWTMVDSPTESLEVLRKHLKPERADQDIHKLIANLDDPSFLVRDKAMRQLARLGHAAQELLIKRLQSRPSLEMSRRIQRLLQDIKGAPSLDHLQRIRGVEVLERIGTAASFELIRELAEGADGAYLTSHAREVLERRRLSARIGSDP
jgi:WD40 repeat protein